MSALDSANDEVNKSKELSVLELLVNTSKQLSSEVELEKLVQRITDVGTQVTGAAFGAFFYNVLNPVGEKYVLYTISGVPKEAFSKFPMPRNTKIFNPTFQGEGIIRYDDVTKQPHFGQNPPYNGHPKGHLPVRSYLAIPVISSIDGEVIGGLFFGHPEAGVFTEESEKLIKGIAAQAAISMANARLFEEKKESERKLREQNALINTITNNTMQALFMLNERHECTYMNPAAIAMTGYLLVEIQGKPLLSFIQPSEKSAISKALIEKVQTQGEDRFVHKDGHLYDVNFTASPIIESGIWRGVLIEIRDTTSLEQKVKERTAQLEKINYELLQFTSVASHDLKEPIRKISVFSKLLRERGEGKFDETSLKYTNNIIQSSERMTGLIDELLAFSRLSQAEIKFDKVDLNALLSQIVSDLELTIKEKKAKITFSGLPVVNGNALQLGQVFQNLISNSLKFSYPGRPPEIAISGDSRKIIFSDNGIGFDNIHATKIFEMFQRLHSKDQFEGTGVGLAIVKKIVTMHKGEIRAYSDGEGKGAVFEISFNEANEHLHPSVG